MNRREFLKTAAISSASVLYGCQPQQTSVTLNKPYNIVFIMADDLGPELLGCYGNTEIRTPNIDKLAKTGMFFNTCWTVPVCGPSRALLMTGRYGFRNGYYNMGDRPGGPRHKEPYVDITRTEPIFARILQQAGYETGIAGKWQMVAPTNKTIPRSGFHHYFTWQISYKEGYGDVQHFPDGPRGPAGSRYFHPSITHNGNLIKTQPSDFGPDYFTSFISSFIRDNKDKPFLAYYSACLPHRPIGPTPDHPDQPVENSEQALKINVEYFDKLVGRIVQTLDDQGLRERTVIFFTGDNGTEEHGKNTPTEAGSRVPMIVNCPGLVRPVGATDALMDFSDILPTMVELADAHLPTNFTFDGKSLVPLLTGQTNEHRDWIFSYMGQFRMLRTDKWMLENECPDYPGDFYYCGNHRDIKHYKNVTDSTDSKVIKMREKFDEILAGMPPPDLSVEDRIWFLNYLQRYNPDLFDKTRYWPKGVSVTKSNN